MKNLLISTAAVVALAGAAHAQEAFITQVGALNSALNYSEEYRSGAALQVIVQQGEGFSAANFSRGGDNTAMAYQIDEGYNATGQSNMADSDPNTPGIQPGGTMESLIWQKASDGGVTSQDWNNQRDA